MNKPIILIDDGSFNVNIDLSEPFNDSDMVEKYTSLQALIDMIYKDRYEDPNSKELDS